MDDEKASRHAERLSALNRANQVRGERAELKRGIRTGALQVADLLVSPPATLRSASVEELLLCAPGYGPVRVGRLLDRCRIRPSKTIGALTDRQRRELARWLAESGSKEAT